MARRRIRSEVSVSLFPFLSILACVIGTLTLMIAALALGEMVTSRQSHPGTPSQDELRSLVERIEASSRALGDTLESRRRLATLRNALQALGFAHDITADQLRNDLEARNQLERLEGQRLAREAELESTRAAVRVLETEIHNLDGAPENAPVQILPYGAGPLLAPYFVECREDGVRIRRKDGSFSEVWSLDDLVSRGRFNAFLEEVRVRGNATAIFLLRPGGVEVFERAELLATNHFVRFGKLPIPGDGEIDFKRYDESRHGGAGR